MIARPTLLRSAALLAALSVATMTSAQARMGSGPPTRVTSSPSSTYQPDKIKPLKTVTGDCREVFREHPGWAGPPPLPGQKLPPPTTHGHGKMTGVQCK